MSRPKWEHSHNKVIRGKSRGRVGLAAKEGCREVRRQEPKRESGYQEIPKENHQPLKAGEPSKSRLRPSVWCRRRACAGRPRAVRSVEVEALCLGSFLLESSSPSPFFGRLRFLARQSASAARSTTPGTRIAGCYRQSWGPLLPSRSFLCSKAVEPESSETCRGSPLETGRHSPKFARL